MRSPPSFPPSILQKTYSNQVGARVIHHFFVIGGGRHPKQNKRLWDVTELLKILSGGCVPYGNFSGHYEIHKSFLGQLETHKNFTSHTEILNIFTEQSKTYKILSVSQGSLRCVKVSPKSLRQTKHPPSRTCWGKSVQIDVTDKNIFFFNFPL